VHVWEGGCDALRSNDRPWEVLSMLTWLDQALTDLAQQHPNWKPLEKSSHTYCVSISRP